MKIATYYADCVLPDAPKAKQDGFDWRWAIRELSRTAAQQNAFTQVVTDTQTYMPDAWLRTGNAKESGIMQWLLEAQKETIKAATEPMVMVSPDTLISRRMNFLFGDWDLCLLTRRKPKPIVNSVIAFRPSERMTALWEHICEVAKSLPQESKEWGADIDALVNVLGIRPSERGARSVHGVRVKFIPIEGVFQSAPSKGLSRMNAVFWDFKGGRKRLMPDYAKML